MGTPPCAVFVGWDKSFGLPHPFPALCDQGGKPISGELMRSIFFALLFFVSTTPLFAQGAPPQGGADQPYVMEYYYKTQWGHQQEFLQLFLKNHYPLLKKQVESGRILSIKIETPANHMTEDARW